MVGGAGGARVGAGRGGRVQSAVIRILLSMDAVLVVVFSRTDGFWITSVPLLLFCIGIVYYWHSCSDDRPH